MDTNDARNARMQLPIGCNTECEACLIEADGGFMELYRRAGVYSLLLDGYDPECICNAATCGYAEPIDVR